VPRSGLRRPTYSVAAYAGQAMTLKFTGTEDNEYQTSFVVTSFVVDGTAPNVTLGFRSHPRSFRTKIS
jgi:hypothetical protein